MGFGQGLSGLNSAAQELDVIGNNIANANTVGFKASTVAFADIYATSKVGLGSKAASVNQRFTVGTITNTGNQLDLAIDGAAGLFRVEDQLGNVMYTRNGQFFQDANNFIVNAQGQRLTGFGETGTDPNPIRVPVGNLQPVPTAAITTKANLNAKAPAIVEATTPFTPLDPASYTHSLPITIYDSLGNPVQLTQFFIKRDTGWDVEFEIPNISYDPENDLPEEAFENVGSTTLGFSNSGLLDPADAVYDLTIPEGDLDGAAEIKAKINYTGTTSYSGEFAYNFTQDGFPTGDFSNVEIGQDGAVTAVYTNGERRVTGYVALANFNNLNGLRPVGDNAWVETGASGQPILGRPGTNGLALIRGQAVEESNVDMSQELVRMIISQRFYQANAQTIKTQDQILQTLITMR